MQYDDIQFHNIRALPAASDSEGYLLQRIPEEIRQSLNKDAQSNYQRPAGAELRFVPKKSVQVRLSSPNGKCTIRPFWGPFQSEARILGPEPRTIELEMPSRIRDLRAGVIEAAFEPWLCRLVLPHSNGPIHYHGVEGDVRPPRPNESPTYRYLAYGTSITRGFAATEPHLTYVAQTARRLSIDSINLGTAGSAFCEPAMADHIAGRDDWDVATLALSVNMVGEFSIETFRERVSYMITRVAEANPDQPIICITLFPYFADLCSDLGEHENYRQFRTILREAVRDAPANARLVEGSELLTNSGGLNADLVHPGDNAMIDIGEHLANRLGLFIDTDIN